MDALPVYSCRSRARLCGASRRSMMLCGARTYGVPDRAAWRTAARAAGAWIRSWALAMLTTSTETPAAPGPRLSPVL